MPRKGVVVVPSGAQGERMREGPAGTQRISNRPIICHVLDALRDAGATELAVVAAAGPVLDLAAVAGQLADNGERLHVGQVRTWRNYSGNPTDLLELNRVVLDQLTMQTEPFSNGDNRVEGRVEIHPTAQVTGSV